MRDEEQLIRKKPKRRRRFTRFILMLIMFIIIISLVFYSIENPSFISNAIERLRSFYTGSGQVKDTSQQDPETGLNNDEARAEEPDENLNEDSNETSRQEDAGGEESSQEENLGTITSGINDGHETTINEEGAQDDLTFWQKILSFFKRGLKKDNKNFPSSLELKVYFASLGEEAKFSYEKRTIIAGDPKIAVENTVKELLEGPHKSFNFSVIPPGTKLRDVEIYENLAKINLSQEFLDNSLESGVLDKYVIYTIVNTVTQVPGVEGVIFLIEAKRIKIYGSIDLSIPAIRNEDFLNKDGPAEDY